MNVKTNNIMARVDAQNGVIIKMDKSSGYSRITITKRSDSRYVIGTIPGARLVNATRAEVVAMLAANTIYVISWN